MVNHNKASAPVKGARDRRAVVPHPKLTQAQRDCLPSSDFALPEKRQYPIPDRYHAELALRDLHHASLEDQVRIRQAIRQKFPPLC